VAGQNGSLGVLTDDTRLFFKPLGASVDTPATLINATAVPLQQTVKHVTSHTGWCIKSGTHMLYADQTRGQFSINLESW